MEECALDIEGGNDPLVGVRVQRGVLEEDCLEARPACHGPHMLARTWAKTACAMLPRISVHNILTLVVVRTMGRQLPRCRQSPFL